MTLPDRPPRIGQRWMWTYPGDRYTVEIVEVEFPSSPRGRVVQKNDPGCSYSVGNVVTPALSQDRWVLLRGQEAP